VVEYQNKSNYSLSRPDQQIINVKKMGPNEIICSIIVANNLRVNVEYVLTTKL
jgi:hypothetical protein